ncbi:transcription factor HES-7.1-B-like [Ascaphus truei]|uniref:transcription factor HES-7.1-B-like n=1 Tax=Ascaphus truei TaxID=8439 RepID=UPI003F5AABA0
MDNLPSTSVCQITFHKVDLLCIDFVQETSALLHPKCGDSRFANLTGLFFTCTELSQPPSSPFYLYRALQTSQLLKPLVEKKRRERINTSLEKLRLLLAETLADEKLKNPKIEKAEILENTVQFLQSRMPVSGGGQEESWQDYQSGFQECLHKALLFVNSNREMDNTNKASLSHYFSSIKPPRASPGLGTASPSCASQIRLLPTPGSEWKTPTLAHQEPAPPKCPGGISVDHTKTLVDVHGSAALNQARMSWRPWV